MQQGNWYSIHQAWLCLQSAKTLTYEMSQGKFEPGQCFDHLCGLTSFLGSDNGVIHKMCFKGLGGGRGVIHVNQGHY